MPKLFYKHKRKGGGGPSGPAGFSDDFSIAIKIEDTNAGQTDADTYAIAYEESDTNAGQSETVELKFPAGVWGEDNSVPTDSQVFTMQVWLSGSAGSGVDSPSNADGEDDGAVATVQTALLGSAIETLTSDVGVNMPAGVSVAAASYRGWFNAVDTLTGSCTVIATSSGGLFGDVTMHSGDGSFLDGSFTFDLVAAGIDTAAKLGSLQILHRTADLVAGVTPSTITVDAGAIELDAAF